MWGAGSASVAVRLLSSIQNKSRLSLSRFNNSVHSATFSRDGKRVLTASEDRTVRLWEVFENTQDLVAHARASVSRCLTREERFEAFLDLDPPAWCIELEKWPYQTQEWKDWLKHKSANTHTSPAD
jgi:hypothetical protein